ncbi:MAG: cation-translocating P-type ATPase [Candidatus Nanohalobium sp.]
MEWHSRDSKEVLEDLDTGEDGLSEKDVERRREKYGENNIRSSEDISPLRIFFSQFNDFLIYLLIAAALFSGLIGEILDAALIFLILLGNGIFGFIQDYKAEKSIEALKDLSTPSATVIRGGEKKKVDSEELVPGDVIFLEQGDAVPADARVLDAQTLETDESALTGESSSESKQSEAIDEDTPLAERSNMVYMNTTAIKGRGKAVVTETGMETEIGEIADEINGADDRETPFQKEVNELGKTIGYGIMAVIAIVAATQFFFTSAKPVSIILVAITLAVAAVPEGLPAVVTLTLALGSKKMLKKDALVRKLPVVESLGSIDTIVTDKTGTLTEGTMTVEKIYSQGVVSKVTGEGLSTDGEVENREKMQEALEVGYICNNAEKRKGEYHGDPTEVALKVSAEKAGFDPGIQRVREIPFSSDRKRMTVVSDEGRAYMKGAPSVVLDRCDTILIEGEEIELTDNLRGKVLEKNDEFARDALRVLAFARKDGAEADADKDDIESGMTFVGMQGMIDPPRSEVKEAVDDCRDAGIDVVMATGDNVETAKAIGEQLGFNPENALTGPEVDEMEEHELQEKVEDVEIFARVSPENKVEILKALQKNSKTVAMTGDGVNDAPALKNSDVGIAMGERGTDVAQQSSDMVLQDDNFVTIRDAIAEGRAIFDNIRKFVNYLLSANTGEVLTVFLGILIGSFLFPQVFQANSEALILTPVMLLWLNLVTDGLPALALGADPKSEGIMKREPRGKDEPVINKRMLASIGGIGFIIAAIGLPLFFRFAGSSLLVAQTVLFTFLVMIEMVRIQTIRSRYDQSILSNRWLIGALASSSILQLGVLYTPVREYLKVVALGAEPWIYLGAGFGAFLILSYVLSSVTDFVFSD